MLTPIVVYLLDSDINICILIQIYKHIKLKFLSRCWGIVSKYINPINCEYENKRDCN